METTKKKIVGSQFDEFMRIIDPRYYGIIVAVLVVLVSLAIVLLYRRRQSAKRGVLLMGMCNSGKTLLYARLLTDRFISTFTSIKENTGDYYSERGILKIVDIPGNERVRGRYFDQYKSIAKAVIFVIDSVTLPSEIRDTAELLYTILTDYKLTSGHVKILILCNKQDEPNAKSASEVQMLLEKELDLLKTTKSHQLDSTSDSGNKKVSLCNADDTFEFSLLPNFTIDFCECSLAEKSTTGFQEVEEWMDSRII